MLYTEKYGNPMLFDDDSKYYDHNGVALPKYSVSTLPFNTKRDEYYKFNTRVEKQIKNKAKKYS